MKAQAITAAVTAAFIYLIPPETGQQHQADYSPPATPESGATPLVSRDEAGVATDFWPEDTVGVKRGGASFGSLVLERTQSVGRELGYGSMGTAGTSGLPADQPEPGAFVARSHFQEGAVRTMAAEVDAAGVGTGSVADIGDYVTAPGGELLDPALTAETTIANDGGSVWVKDAPLNEVFQYLAQQGNYQFFHNADLAGPSFVVTGHLNEGDPLAQMEELGMMYGVTVYQKGQTVYAMTQVQLTQLPRKPLQYHLKYLRPTDIDQIKTILQPVLTPGSGSIDYETKTNTLLIYDNEQKIESVLGILGEMDQPKQQIAIETRILRVKSSASNRIGVDWSSVLGDGLTFESIASLNNLFNLPDADTVSQVVTMTREATNIMEDLSSGVFSNNRDRSGTFSDSFSSSTAAGVVTTSPFASDFSGTSNFGNSSLLDSSFDNTGRAAITRTEENIQSVSRTGSPLVLAPLQVSAVLRALNTGNLAQQESSPTIITEDNEEGLISIIDRVPLILTTISETDFGQNITEEVRYRIDADDPVNDPSDTREIGVTVAVTPTILPDDTIRMLLRPRSAQIVEFIQGQTGNLYPRVNESTIQTIARVPNGYSLMIGGVYEETEAEITNKVPLLGDVPGLNFMFKSTEKSKEHTSLVFVVTPTTYTPVSIPENTAMLRHLHDLHVLPADHASPDRDKPNFNYETRPFRSFLQRTPPSNTLHPEHPINDVALNDEAYQANIRQHQAPVSDSRKKRGLFNRNR